MDNDYKDLIGRGDIEMEVLFRKSVRGMIPYDAPYITKGIKLDANENTYPLLEEMKEHMSKWAKTMPINYYPDTNSTKLREAIGKLHHIEPEWVLCGVGSDQIIDCLMRSTLEVGESVLVPTPSFSMYKLTANINHGKVIEVPLTKDFAYDVDALEEALLKERPKLTFICNPNNPTGTILDIDEIKRLANHEIGFLVVDEAYLEFGGTSAISLLKTYKRLIILRTFSKAYGLAGSRVGYAIANKEVIEMIGKVKPPYNLNCFSEEIATWVANHHDKFLPRIEEILESREDFSEYLLSLGCMVYPSWSNFLWVEAKWPLDELLKEESIYVKGFFYKDKVYYRLSIGTREEMRQVKASLKMKLEGQV